MIFIDRSVPRSDDAARARPPRLRIGLALDWGTERTTLDRLLKEYLPLIQLAERYGFDSLWVGQHFPTGPDMFHPPSPLLVLAAVAPHTSLMLGTGVLLLPMWNPITLAYEAAVLDQLCGGRLVLGVGIGRPRDWTKFGLPREVIGRPDGRDAGGAAGALVGRGRLRGRR